MLIKQRSRTESCDTAGVRDGGWGRGSDLDCESAAGGAEEDQESGDTLGAREVGASVG